MRPGGHFERMAFLILGGHFRGLLGAQGPLCVLFFLFLGDHFGKGVPGTHWGLVSILGILGFWGLVAILGIVFLSAGLPSCECHLLCLVTILCALTVYNTFPAAWVGAI